MMVMYQMPGMYKSTSPRGGTMEVRGTPCFTPRGHSKAASGKLRINPRPLSSKMRGAWKLFFDGQVGNHSKYILHIFVKCNFGSCSGICLLCNIFLYCDHSQFNHHT